MAAEAQMRCAPACTSGRQHTGHLPRVIIVSSKSEPCWRRSGLMEPCNLSLFKLRSQAARTRRALRRGSYRDTESHSPQTADSQLTSLDEDSSDDRRLAAQAAPLAGIVAAISIMLVLPASADAKEGLPLDFLTKFLDQVQQLGPWGPVAFIVAVICAEMIPLFPTQPLALSSGLLFGATEGALCTMVSTTLAASIAYTLAQGLGRSFAQKMIDSEVGVGSEGKDNMGQKALKKVQASVEEGSFWQQFSAVLALRMTPVLPFSATNYLLGLSSVPFKPFLAATFAAMAVWGPLYASIGAASRGVLKSRGDVGAIFADLQARTGQYSEKGAEVALVIGLVVLGLWVTGVIKTGDCDDRDSSTLEQK